MSTELAIYGASVPDRMKYSEALSGSTLLPADYRGKPANVLLALEYGNALGIPPMTAIQGVHIINGKPTASAGLIGALVRKAGHRLRVTGDAAHAVCEIVRHDDPEFTFRSKWTWDRAVAAKLTGKDTWKNFPAAMLKARAITECARDACPEALAGVNYTPEELGDDGALVEAYPMTGDGAEDAPPKPGHEPAPSSPDIEDAVVVDDSDAADGGEASVASVNRNAHRPGVPAYRDRASAQRDMFRLLREVKPGTDEERRAFVASVVGEFESHGDLTYSQIVDVVAALKAAEAAS